MLALLLRHRVRVWWNGLTRGANAGRQSTGAALTAVFLLLACAFAFFVTRAIVENVAETEPDTLPAILALLFVGSAGFVLLTQTAAITHQLYLSSDLEVLLAAPVSLRTLFALKLTETSLLGGVVGALQLAALAGYGQGREAPLLYYLLAPLLLAAVIVLSTATAMLVIMLVMRVVPARSMTGIVSLLGASLGALVWLLFQFGSRAETAETARRLEPAARRLQQGSGWLPTTWAAEALTAAADGRPAALAGNLGLLAAAGAVMLGLAWTVFRYSFYVSAGRVREATPRGNARERRSTRPGPAQLLPAPVRAIVLKDWHILRRDLRLVSGLVFPLVMTGFWSFRFISGSGDDAGAEGFWLGVGAVPFLLLFVTSQLSLTAFGREGHEYALLHMAPLSPGTLVAAKTVAGALPTALLAWVLVLVAGVWRGASPVAVVAALLMAAWLAAGVTAANTAAGALNTRFDADNPQKSVGCMGSVLSFAVGGLFVATSTALFGWLVVLALGEWSFGPLAALLITGALLAVAIVGVAVVGVTARLAAGRLAAWEET